MNKSKNKIHYKIRSSTRAKHLRLAVYCDGSVVVTKPRHVPTAMIDHFIRQKADWILSKLAMFTNFKSKLPPASREDYLAKKDQARQLVQSRLEQINQVYGLEYSRIAIKNQKTRWGSCSGKRNLNFNYRIVYLPPELADYIITHELCHLKEMNHSPRFWALVSQTLFNYRQLRRGLKEWRLGN